MLFMINKILNLVLQTMISDPKCVDFIIESVLFYIAAFVYGLTGHHFLGVVGF